MALPNLPLPEHDMLFARGRYNISNSTHSPVTLNFNDRVAESMSP
jgi:hypothetical protein